MRMPASEYDFENVRATSTFGIFADEIEAVVRREIHVRFVNHHHAVRFLDHALEFHALQPDPARRVWLGDEHKLHAGELAQQRRVRLELEFVVERQYRPVVLPGCLPAPDTASSSARSTPASRLRRKTRGHTGSKCRRNHCR